MSEFQVGDKVRFKDRHREPLTWEDGKIIRIGRSLNSDGTERGTGTIRAWGWNAQRGRQTSCDLDALEHDYPFQVGDRVRYTQEKVQRKGFQLSWRNGEITSIRDIRGGYGVRPWGRSGGPTSSETWCEWDDLELVPAKAAKLTKSAQQALDAYKERVRDYTMSYPGGCDSGKRDFLRGIDIEVETIINFKVGNVRYSLTSTEAAQIRDDLNERLGANG